MRVSANRVASSIDITVMLRSMMNITPGEPSESSACPNLTLEAIQRFRSWKSSLSMNLRMLVTFVAERMAWASADWNEG